MKIAIITLPLHTNYGGILQAFALKKVLECMGHEVSLLDLKVKMPAPGGLKAPFVYLKRALKGREVFREKRYDRELPILSADLETFIVKNIKPVSIDSYSNIREGEYDAFVVGSDQVWRPLYFHPIEDAFLAFARGWDVKRVAYAASFGTDKLEYEYMQLEACAKLLSAFDGVSVREDSAVAHCAEWFDYEDAVHVLDPVMLLDADIYRKEAECAAERTAKGKIVTYLLDASDEKGHVVDFMGRVSGLDVHDVSILPYDKSRPVRDRVAPAVEIWLAAFADAEFIVTDSFHGCVLAILMHKRFVAVGNNRRGMARLSSLLTMFGLDMRLVQGIDPEDDGEFFMSDPDWGEIDRILEEKRKSSVEFLMNALIDSHE